MDIVQPILTYDPFSPACSPPLSYDSTIAIAIVAAVLGVAWTAYNLIMLRRIDLSAPPEPQGEEGEEGLAEDMPQEQKKLLLQFGFKVYDAALQFLKLQYLACLALVILAFLLLWFLTQLGIQTAIAFIVGAVISVAAGLVGFIGSTRANCRVAYCSKFGLGPAFRTAYQASSAIGFGITSMHLLALTLTIHLSKQQLSLVDASSDPNYYKKLFESVAGYALGASLVALCTKMGGGIFEAATEVGSQMAGKIQGALAFNHFRNAATISLHAGINAGVIVGANSDLLGSYSELTCVAFLLSSTSLVGWQGDNAPCAVSLAALTLPLVIISIGLVVSIAVGSVGVIISWVQSDQQLTKTIRLQRLLPALVMAGMLYLCAFLALPDSFQLLSVSSTFTDLHAPYEAYICALAGTIIALILSLFAEFATHRQLPFLNAFADRCRAGTAATITLGLAFGYLYSVIPTILVCLAAYLSYHLLGFYGIAVAVLAYLSTAPLQLALQSLHAIAADASTAARIAALNEEEKDTLNLLSEAGDTALVVNRGVSMGCAALVGLTLFGGFLRNSSLDRPVAEDSISLTDPVLFTGLLVGAIFPFLLAGLSVKASRKATEPLLEQIQRQLREDEGIARGQSQADYAASVRPAVKTIVLRMIVPVLLVAVAPFVFGLAIGPKILAGILMGIIVSGLQFASSATTSGDAWSAARKHIESGVLTDPQGRVVGVGSEAHRAGIIGTGVGSAFRKCAGGSLNPAIKLIGMVAVLFGNKFAELHP